MKARVIEVTSPAVPANPVVSVSLITFNHEDFIAQAIEGVLAQTTTFPVELVIGDDCSTDGTREILHAYQRRFPDRIRLLLQSRNVGGARNAIDVVAACRGRYIAMLEGDDYWTDEAKLQAQVGLMEANPRAFLCGARAHVWRHGDAAPQAVAPDADPATLAAWGSAEMVRGLWWFRTCTKLLPARVLRELPVRFAGDWSGTLWLIARHPGAEIAFLDRVVGVYRLHPGGDWSSRPVWRRLTKDIRTLYNVIPGFTGENRQVLVSELHQRVHALITGREAPARERFRCTLLALRRCPGDRRAWRNLARLAGWESREGSAESR